MHSMLGIAPARGKCYKKHSMYFAPQNKEDDHERIHSKSSRWKKFNTACK